MPVVRCKMRVNEVLISKKENGETESERVSLTAVMAPYGSKEDHPNAKWSKWTPNASFSIQINNPDAMGKLSRGHEYFVDFTDAAELPAHVRPEGFMPSEASRD